MIDGAVLVDKEEGWTSHDVVQRLRRTFGQSRVGHAGTLDPDATGVLVVGLGRATRLLRFIGQGDKRYEGRFVLGISTSTLDASGRVLETCDMSGLSQADLERAASNLTGEIEQIPPMVSARRVGGVRLHELARRGAVVDREPARVTVSRFDVELAEGGDPSHPEVSFEAVCSAGTYIRVLAEDLGSALGGCGHVKTLRRTAVGPFRVEDAARVAEVTGASVLSIASALRAFERCVVAGDTATRVTHGRPLQASVLGVGTDGPWLLVADDGRVLAVYESAGGGLARPGVVLAPAGAPA